MTAKKDDNAKLIKEFRWLLGGWTQEQAANACGVPVRTYRRWENGTHRAPVAAIRLLGILAAGHLGEISPEWSGWRIIKNKLVSPENTIFGAGEVRALPFQYARIASLEKKSRDLEQRQEDLRYAAERSSLDLKTG